MEARNPAISASGNRTNVTILMPVGSYGTNFANRAGRRLRAGLWGRIYSIWKSSASPCGGASWPSGKVSWPSSLGGRCSVLVGSRPSSTTSGLDWVSRPSRRSGGVCVSTKSSSRGSADDGFTAVVSRWLARRLGCGCCPLRAAPVRLHPARKTMEFLLWSFGCWHRQA